MVSLPTEDDGFALVQIGLHWQKISRLEAFLHIPLQSSEMIKETKYISLDYLRQYKPSTGDGAHHFLWEPVLPWVQLGDDMGYPVVPLVSGNILASQAEDLVNKILLELLDFLERVLLCWNKTCQAYDIVDTGL